MSSETLLLIILAVIAAILLSLFQYRFKAKSISKKQMLFAFLRFLTVFGILVLIINPKFKQIEYFVEKPTLSIVIDNSSSINFLSQVDKLKAIKKQLSNNLELKDRFDVNFYSFNDKLYNSDTLNFSGTQTNISKALNSLKEINKDLNAPVILLTDGNQTYGDNFEFSLKNYDQPIFPVILGDTIKYTDLKIQQLNANRYTYLKNKFPVEVIINYDGEDAINSKFIISSGTSVLYSENLSLSKNNNSKIINTKIATSTIGVKKLKAEVIPLESEKNKANNTRQFAVEVVDQKTNIAIISDISHPDIGTLKKTIESNEQRFVEILKSSEYISKKYDYQLIILHQPNNKFNSIFKDLENNNKNFFTIIGTKTDLRFLNNVQKYFYKKVSPGVEDVQPLFNNNFSTFITNEINFSDFPPLKIAFGEVKFSTKNDVLLYNKIANLETNYPLLATYEVNKSRRAVLFGEGIWKWRAHSYINNQDFEEFDVFIGKLIQYLASSKKRDRLNLSFESFYYGHDHIVISAEFFDKNYTFNPNALLEIEIKNKNNNTTIKYPMLLKNNHYEVDLSSFSAAEYDFTVRSTTEKISKSGSFSILEFEVEKQFLNADVTKLTRLATNTKGKIFYSDTLSSLISNLINDKRFTPIQKSKENIVPLIDWKWILALITFTLSTEWFLRKYNGLI